MKKIFSSLLIVSISLLALSAQELDLKESKEFNNLGEYVRQAQFSPYRNFFAISIGNNALRVYDRDWEKVFEHQGNPEAYGGVFAFSPDEKFLAYGRFKGYNDIAIFRLPDMKLVDVLARHTSYINHLEFSNDGAFLVSSSADQTAIVWYREKDRFLFRQHIDAFEYDLNESSFSYDDRFLVTGDERGNILVLERTGERYREFQQFRFRRHGVESVVFHPRKYEFITGSSYGLRRYGFSGGIFSVSDSVEKGAYVRHPLHYSPDGRYLSLGHYQTAVIMRVGHDSLFPVDRVFRHTESVFGGSFSDDGDFLVTYGVDQRVIIWKTEKVDPLDKNVVVSWLKDELSLAQRRSLSPAAIGKIIRAVDRDLVLPRDEFETSAGYRDRMAKLADWTLMMLQKEMEQQYGVKQRSGYAEIPVQGLVGYNADLQIYKIRFMETEAGVAIPIAAARKFKEKWSGSHVRAVRQRVEGGASFSYSGFEMFNPADRKYYKVTPIENPFHREKERLKLRTEIVGGPRGSQDTVKSKGNTYALMFASNVYDYYSDLVNPVLDAQTIAMELGESYGVVSEVILNPTLAETAEVIREYASRSYKPEDNLMVFFAGHGVYDEVFREGYVISRDSKQDDLGKTSYLSHSNLRTMINNIDCPHIFLVMDVCFGGTFDPHLASLHRGGAAAYADISTREFVERKLKYKTRLYLTSGGKEYVPDGRPGFHSPFARRFIESLRHYGGDDGVLTTAEILQFVEKVNPQPRFGEFGDNEPGSDFILVVK